MRDCVPVDVFSCGCEDCSEQVGDWENRKEDEGLAEIFKALGIKKKKWVGAHVSPSPLLLPNYLWCVTHAAPLTRSKQ